MYFSMTISSGSVFLYYVPAKRMFFVGCSGISLSFCPSMCLSVQNVSFCQSTGGDIKSHLLTALQSFYGCPVVVT